jgi:hypothetical protein
VGSRAEIASGGEPAEHRSGIVPWLRDNSLSITLFLLFVGFLVSDSLSGLNLYNEEHTTHGLPPIGYREFLGSGQFLDGIFVNWQAAILQLASLIIFGMFLVQRGATHSRKLGRRQREKLKGSFAHKTVQWIYDHSLSLAFLVLFLLSFSLHAIFGAAFYNDQRALSGQPPLSIGEFVVSARFWFQNFQTWQAEYFAIAAYILLSIVLRQEGSPESKPVSSSDDDTGVANE